MVNDYRYQDDVKDAYNQRPQHIERIFADGKLSMDLEIHTLGQKKGFIEN